MLELLYEIWFIASRQTTIEKHVKLLEKKRAKFSFAHGLVSWAQSTTQYIRWTENFRGVQHSLRVFDKVLLDLVPEEKNPVICDGRRHSV